MESFVGISDSDRDTSIYGNTGYVMDRVRKHNMILDITDNSVGGINSFDADHITFSISLQEPFIIDSLCDVYIDNLTTFDVLANTGTNTQAFVIDIDQFPIKTTSNRASVSNRLVVPNENTATDALKVHKGKKLNYVCQMNPQTLRQISGSVSNLNLGTHRGGSDFRVIMEFLFISRE